MDFIRTPEGCQMDSMHFIAQTLTNSYGFHLGVHIVSDGFHTCFHMATVGHMYDSVYYEASFTTVGIPCEFHMNTIRISHGFHKDCTVSP